MWFVLVCAGEDTRQPSSADETLPAVAGELSTYHARNMRSFKSNCKDRGRADGVARADEFIRRLA
jgi:hypothetical protein